MRIDTDAHHAYSRIMDHIQSIWPSAKVLASDLGVPYTTAHSWYRRGSFPAHLDVKLVQAAADRGAVLTFEQLAAARARGSAVS